MPAEGLHKANADSVLNSYNLAKEHDPKWAKAWHAWALSNMDIVRILPGAEVTEVATRHTCHIVAAVEGKLGTLECVFEFTTLVGFVRSLGLMGRNTLQGALSLLTLWFKYGAQPAITTAMVKGFESVNCNLWLDVVPQVCY